MSSLDTVTTTIRTRLHDQVEEWHPRLIDLSHSLHAEPELGGAEVRSAQKVRALLEEGGFSLAADLPAVPTGFVATAGSGELVVALCIEYDALPDIGHGCGHNVHGAAVTGAAIALASVADELGITVRAIGTPAEETIGAKVDLIEAGAFDGVACALMVHAYGVHEVGWSSKALSAWDIEYIGRPSHAAGAPDAGINALDALVVAQTAIALARQQLPAGVIVSLIVLEGGSAPNVIPARARAAVEMRALTADVLARVREKVRACLDAGALASGATLTVTPRGHDFDDLRQDTFLTTAYVEALASMGIAVRDASGYTAGSTDMGNVSHVVPAIHPMLGYDVDGAAGHTAEFAAAGISASADAAIATGAWGIAAAAAAAATDATERQRLLQRVRDRWH